MQISHGLAYKMALGRDSASVRCIQERQVRALRLLSMTASNSRLHWDQQSRKRQCRIHTECCTLLIQSDSHSSYKLKGRELEEVLKLRFFFFLETGSSGKCFLPSLIARNQLKLSQHKEKCPEKKLRTHDIYFHFKIDLIIITNTISAIC